LQLAPNDLRLGMRGIQMVRAMAQLLIAKCQFEVLRCQNQVG